MKSFFPISTSVVATTILLSALNVSNAAVSIGGIAVIGFTAEKSQLVSNPQAVSWVALENIAAGEVIYFSDISYTGSGFDNHPDGEESLVRYVAPLGGLTAGSVQTLYYDNIGSDYSELTGTAYDEGKTGNDSDDPFPAFISVSGDQIVVFQDDDVSNDTNFSAIYAVDFNSSGWTYDAVSDFDQSSALYPGLIDGVNALNLGESDSGRYTGTTTGDAATVLAAITNGANWSQTDDHTVVEAGGLNWTNNDVSAFTIPEPSSITLLALGGLAATLRRRRN